MTKRSVMLIGLALLLAPAPTRAQTRWTFEARGGLGVLTRDVQDADLGTGFGFDGTIGFRLAPDFAVYGGWGWMHFSADESFGGPDVDFEETAYLFGVRLERPFAASGSGTAYWLRAGGSYGQIELEDSGGDRFAGSGRGLGWEVGAGVAFDVGRVRLTPGARFRARSRELTVEDVTTPVELRYVAIEVAVLFPLG